MIREKCCGKNVRLIDKNKFKKLIFSQLLFIIIFNIRGDQKIKLEKIEKITPIDNT